MITHSRNAPMSFQYSQQLSLYSGRPISIESFVQAMRGDLDDFIEWWYAQHKADEGLFPLDEHSMQQWADEFAAFGGLVKDKGYE
jgi:hypothetical protein